MKCPYCDFIASCEVDMVKHFLLTRNSLGHFLAEGYARMLYQEEEKK
jgi:hypothetical protein